MGSATAVNGKCPDGYTHVFGPLCVEKTTLAKIDDVLPGIPDTSGFTDPACESALASLKSSADQLEKLIKLPRKIMNAAQRLLDYPFNTAKELLDKSLSSIDSISDAIDAFTRGPASMLDDLRRALEKALECPLIVDSSMGALIASILDTIDKGGQIDKLLNKLKDYLSSAADDYLNELKKTPAEALSNLSKLFDDVIKRSGIKELINQLQGLEKCVEAACDLVAIADRLPKSSASFLESINASFDEATGEIKTAVVKPVNAAQETAAQVANDFKLVKAKVATTR